MKEIWKIRTKGIYCWAMCATFSTKKGSKTLRSSTYSSFIWLSLIKGKWTQVSFSIQSCLRTTQISRSERKLRPVLKNLQGNKMRTSRSSYRSWKTLRCSFKEMGWTFSNKKKTLMNSDSTWPSIMCTLSSIWLISWMI